MKPCNEQLNRDFELVVGPRKIYEDFTKLNGVLRKRLTGWVWEPENQDEKQVECAKCLWESYALEADAKNPLSARPGMKIITASL